MDFTASSYQQTIPSQSSFVPSDNQLEYRDGQTIRFEIPSFMGFIDPRQTYLKYKVAVENSPAVCTFSKKCGVHSLINQLRIYDANSNLQMETIQNYAELAEKLHYYSENASVRNKRGITELLEYTSRNFDGKTYDDLPSRNFNNSMLFDCYQSGNGNFSNANRLETTTATSGVLAKSNTAEVAQRLYSGILGSPSTKMFPAMLTNGLRVELDLNSARKALQLWSGAGVCLDTGLAPMEAEESCFFGIQSCSGAGGAGAPLTQLDLYTEKNAGFNQIVFAAGGAGAVGGYPTQAAIDFGLKPVRNQLIGASNVLVGKRIHAWTNAAVPVLVDCGVVASVACNASENAGGLCVVSLTMTPNSAAGGAALPNVNTLTGGAGKALAGAAGVAQNNLCFIKQSDMFNSTPKIVLTDVELVVKTAAPPKSYVDKLLKQAQTEEGATYDFMTYNVYRNNTTASESVIQLNIPALNNRATSVLTLPTKNGEPEELYNDNLATYVDNADNYNFLVANKSQPTRKVSLAGCSQTPSLTEQVALWETEKALGSSKVMVRNLNTQDQNLIIGRSLSRYGGVYPLVKDGGLQLKIEYKTAPANPQLNKLFITYIGGLRRLRVSKEGSFIEQ